MRLLVVEDDDHLRRQVSESLQESGYAVDVAVDGREGLYLGEETDYDLAIVDLGLPELPGIDMIRQLRMKGRVFPILILTARGDWQDKVEGLEAGADDYVVKPFHMEEILARINVLLRRRSGHASPSLNFGDLVIDTAAKTVRLSDQELSLTSYEYNTLVYFAHNPGKVISKTELTEHLYDQDYDRDSNVIEVFVGRLRKKIDPEGQTQPIKTVRGQGYRFDLE